MQLKALIRQKYNPVHSITFFPHITQDGYTVKNVHVFVSVFLYAVTMLIFQIGLSSNHNCLARQIRYFCASAYIN